ncbi:MAG: oxygenase MpaB family protein [Bernardetiaceae bacterium]
MMRYTNEFLDTQRQATDPQAEALVRAALAQDPKGFWRFLTDWESESIPEAFTDLVTEHCPGYAAPPAGMSAEEITRSELFFEQYSEAIFLLLGAYSLPYCYAAEAGVQVLYQTQRLSKEPLKRLQETGLFVFNILETNSFSNGKAWLSILRVRLMHAAVRVKVWESGRWDTARWGQPINQEDLAGTLFAFSLIVILGLRKLGYRISAKEAMVYFRRWHLIGERLGVAPEMRPDAPTAAFALAKRIEKRHLRPSQAGKSLNDALIHETEKSTEGQLPRGFVPALMRYLLGQPIARCLGLPESGWADPLIQLNLLRQRHLVLPTRPTPTEVHTTYRATKARLLAIA